MPVTSNPTSLPVPKQPGLIDPADAFPAGGGQRAFQLLDVRAPVEVQRCGIPGAAALPILTDKERAAVGTCYREKGQSAAIALGLELTAPHREARVAAWRDAVASSDRPTAFACWRGGQRSGIASQWLGDSQVPRVQGGTKALRRYLMAGLQSQFETTRGLVISGLTGCGKTDLLHELLKVVPPDVLALDLEGLANHRGSAFGEMPAGQPSQQTFENELAATVHLAAPRVTLLEDEARYVGRLELPEYVYTMAKVAPIVLLEATHSERVARIAREYVFEPSKLSSHSVVRAGLEVNLNKLAKRLGGVRMQECLQALACADHEEHWFSIEAHTPWIDILLLHYYDKFYESAMTRLARPVAFRGSAAEVIAWFAAKGYEAG